MACNCTAIVTSPPPSVVCGSGSCIYTPDLLISQANSIPYCSLVAGTIDISTKVKTSVCTETVFYSIKAITDNVQDLTINSTQITFLPKPGSDNEVYAELEYKVTCGFYENRGKIIIIFKDNSLGVQCDENEIASKCTGDCEPAPPDLFTNLVDPDLFT